MLRKMIPSLQEVEDTWSSKETVSARVRVDPTFLFGEKATTFARPPHYSPPLNHGH